ncbi:hypothetical protein OG974_02905 [Streptomyces sp. NBC_00597]|uniref:hypothetical protein n=1 Tax=Streptomyces sp. NBC_00597 TaxID=2975786 RepID=UPI0030E17BA6
MRAELNTCTPCKGNGQELKITKSRTSEMVGHEEGRHSMANRSAVGVKIPEKKRGGLLPDYPRHRMAEIQTEPTGSKQEKWRRAD